MRVIILEGPDGAGKTTLAKEMQEQEGFHYFRCGVPEPGARLLEFYSGMILNALSTNSNVVIDRCFVGETIYGPVMRNKSLLEPEDFQILIQLCRKFDVLHVFCMPSYEVILSNWTSRRSAEYVDGERKLHAIYQGYRSQACLFPFGSLLFYDYTRRLIGTPCPFTGRQPLTDEDCVSIRRPRTI